ncbi:MAG: hypothetical protein JSV04_01445 [Candidatus Heimdallarchaeota archaeon]|nr:MAG: hypothetical protein JSV04_01445 [Candidatus Heimdallarchaeota archaeon]
MTSIVEILLLAVPLLLTTGLSFLNFLVFFRKYRQKEEIALLHISVTFICSMFLFFLLFIAVLLPPAVHLQMFLVANIFVWILFLEIGNSYLSAFLNRSSEIDRYILPVFGAAIGLAVLIASKPDLYLITVSLNIELVVFLAAVFTVFFTFARALVRVNLVLDQFEGEELKLLELTQQIFLLGVCSIGFTFITCFLWLISKGMDNLSLEIVTWEVIDWITYLNMPLYAGILLGALLRSLRIDFEQIDVPSILNVLDAPPE